MSQDPKSPSIQAGEEIIDKCPVCKVKFNEPVATNLKHTCPDVRCQAKFCLMIYEE
jgi:hypothetical protein